MSVLENRLSGQGNSEEKERAKRKKRQRARTSEESTLGLLLSLIYFRAFPYCMKAN